MITTKYYFLDNEFHELHEFLAARSNDIPYFSKRSPQQYLPDALVNERLWHGQHNPTEEKMYQRMLNYWGSRFEK